MNLRTLTVAIASFSLASTDAFSIQPAPMRGALSPAGPKQQRPTALSPLHSSTMGSLEQQRGPMTAPEPRRQYTRAEWSAQLTSPDVQEIRSELIAKYLQLGRSAEHATREVDSFLGDPDRSAEFIEMRRRAVVQEEISLGFEDAVMYAAAFLVGVGLDMGARYLFDHMQ